MSLTPEQFNKLVTKDYLDEKLVNYATKADISLVLTAIDGLAKKIDNSNQEASSNIGAHDRLDEKLDNHETRINTLELASAT